MVAPVLLLIDFQKGFDEPRWDKRNNPGAEARVAQLLAHWRAAGAPVTHVLHKSRNPDSPLAPNHPGRAFKPEAAPVAGEAVVERSVNSAFMGTDLLSRLRAIDAHQLVICGIGTAHCVSSTARTAANIGFEVQLVEDACVANSYRTDMSWKPGNSAEAGDLGARKLDPQEIHAHAVAHLHGVFLTAVQSASLLAQPL
ncbi:MAG: cysteine hydrolase family protein [Halocynthiibacter sp.]